MTRALVPTTLAAAMAAGLLAGCATAGLSYGDRYKITASSPDRVAVRYYTHRVGPSEVQDIAQAEAAKYGKKAVQESQTELVKGSGGSVVETLFRLQ